MAVGQWLVRAGPCRPLWPRSQSPHVSPHMPGPEMGRPRLTEGIIQEQDIPPIYALAIWCDPELALANNLAG